MSQLYNQTNLRSPTSSPQKIKIECKFKEMEVASKIAKKLCSYFVFHLKMSSKELLSQWKVDTVIENLPSPKELKFALKRNMIKS